MTVQVSAFYKFVRIDDTVALRDILFAALQASDARGTILLASEGINGTISAAPSAMVQVLADLRADPRFADLVTKDATASEHPFKRLKVKLKREIISFRQAGADPTVRAGTYVKPQDWNALISDPSVLVLDTRNAYEVEAGTFRGAIDPKTRRFGDLPAYVAAHLDPAQHTKVAMFCTGGIRCEKASAFMLSQGYAEVFHLEGGILNYLTQVPRDDSLFEGGCFVFDERETVEGA
jgi:UPF0176 protein